MQTDLPNILTLTDKHEANFYRLLLYPPASKIRGQLLIKPIHRQAPPFLVEKSMDSIYMKMEIAEGRGWPRRTNQSSYYLLLISPLKYQRHADGTTRLSVKSLCGCEYHLRCSQTAFGGSYTRIALFEGFAGKFRLFPDFNFIPRHEHSHDGYSLCLEKPGRVVRTVLSRVLQ